MQKIFVKKTARKGVAFAPVCKYDEPDFTPDAYHVPAQCREGLKRESFDDRRCTGPNEKV